MLFLYIFTLSNKFEISFYSHKYRAYSSFSKRSYNSKRIVMLFSRKNYIFSHFKSTPFFSQNFLIPFEITISFRYSYNSGLSSAPYDVFMRFKIIINVQNIILISNINEALLAYQDSYCNCVSQSH